MRNQWQTIDGLQFPYWTVLIRLQGRNPSATSTRRCHPGCHLVWHHLSHPSRRDPHAAVAWWDGAVSVIDVAWAHGMCGFEPRRFHISLLSPLAPLVVPHSLPSCGSTGCALSSVHPRVLHQVLSTHCALHSVQCALPSVLCPLCPALCPV